MTARRIVLNVPEKVLLAEKTDEAAFARELCMLAAVKLYELGRLSSGRAAELAGVPRVEFLLALGRYQVFPFETELRDLEREDV
jgi:predicted HTH domain antitoxin